MNFISSLTVAPAKVEENFMPNFEKTINYKVDAQNPEQELRIYAEGDLAQYVSLDKEKILGSGEFTANLKFPAEIEKPGKHRIYIVVEEVIPENGETTIGTSVTIKTAIDIYVPYPGKYFEISLSSHNVNLEEPVNLNLEIISWGEEDANIKPKIEIFSLPEQKLIETLNFESMEVKSREKINLKKNLNTKNYNPGNYKAVATIDYGKIAKAESEFKIGELYIEVIDYTKQIIIKDFRPFDIEIENKWNDNIDGVYAEVFIFSDLNKLTDFKTSSTSLIPWEKKTITGFFDTNNFTEGFYDANITLFYYGKNIGKSSSKLVEIELIKEKKNFPAIAILILILIIAGFLIKKNYFNNVK